MENLLMLHGAIGSVEQLERFETELSPFFQLHYINFSGHGGKAFPSEPFSIDFFAKEVIAYLDKAEIKNIHVFGYSMGGYVAMYLANNYPERIKKILTLATKFNWDEASASKENKLLDPNTIEIKLPEFAATLQKRHAPNSWKTVLERTSLLLTQMGKDCPLKPNDFAQIQQPVLLMLGDRDKMVSLQETLLVFDKLPHASLAVLPNTPHPIEMVNSKRLTFEIISFLL